MKDDNGTGGKVTFPIWESLEESCSFHPNTKKISAARMWQCTNIVCGFDNGVGGMRGVVEGWRFQFS